MIITADLIEAYLKCPTKCFLLSRDEVETGNAYAEWARVKSASFCREGIGRLVAGVAPDKCVMSASATENPQWQLAIDFKARSQNLQCSCQALERIPSSERERAARFIPIRFVFRNNVARDDKLLITFNALVLSERLGRTIDYGKVLYGDNYASLRVKISAFADDVRRIQQQRHLHRTQLSYTFRPRHRPKALRDKREKYHHSLKARAIRRYAGPPDGLGVSKALETSINLLSVIFGQIYFPTYSNRLKEIAGWLGFKWSEQEASGLQAIIWRQEWEQTRARLEKEKLVRYNVEDCAALELVTGAVGQIVQENIEGNSGTRDRIEVVVANNVDRKETIWPRFSSSIEGFDIVNRAARWDYQRDHTYIRTEAKLKRDKQVGQTLPRKNIRISKVMVCEPLTSSAPFRIALGDEGSNSYRAHKIRFCCPSGTDNLTCPPPVSEYPQRGKCKNVLTQSSQLCFIQ